MFLRLALCVWMAAMFAIAGQSAAWAQSPAPTPPAPPAGATKPEPTQAAPTPPAAPAPTAGPQSGDPFGEDVTLTAKPMVYVKGNGNWDSAFDTITKSLKVVKAYVDKEGLKVDGQAMTIFTATDDTGFQFEAALPLEEEPKTAPKGDLTIGKSPDGRALKFVHRGSYDAMDATYDAITNYLDEKKLDAKDLFIEEYVSDPLTTPQDKLVIDIFVPVQ